MLIQKIKHDIKMKRLRKNIDYAFGKMREHEYDADSHEWKDWATLNLVYLSLMNEEVNSYADFLGKRSR